MRALAAAPACAITLHLTLDHMAIAGRIPAVVLFSSHDCGSLCVTVSVAAHQCNVEIRMSTNSIASFWASALPTAGTLPRGTVPPDILAKAVAHAKASAAAAAQAHAVKAPTAGGGEEVPVDLVAQAVSHAKATAARLGALTSAKRNAEAAVAASEEQAIFPPI